MKRAKEQSQDVEVKNPTKAPRKLTLLSAIEQIVELSIDSNLNDEFFTKAKRYITYLSKRYSLTPIQAVLFAIFIDKSTDRRIEIRDFARHLGCRPIKIIRYMSDIDELKRRKLIHGRRDDDDDQLWRVPSDVVTALKDDKLYVPKPITNLSCGQLFDQLDKLFTQRKEGELSAKCLSEETLALLDANTHLSFCRELKPHQQATSDSDLMLLLAFCQLFVFNNDNQIRKHDIEYLYESKWDVNDTIRALLCGSSYWLIEGYIDFAANDGFLERDAFQLTAKAKTELLSELNIPLEKPIKKNTIIACDSIVKKELFYNWSEQQQVARLAELLQPEKFRSIQDSLTQKGMRKGFACLFYGAPGTGKTETAYQLAKTTGRDIMQVNIAEMKSCWVGESEKNIQALFDTYRKAFQRVANGAAPILLFNEADALINQRKSGSAAAVDKMENAMQNIILQEMEKLEGILIATTNLTQNLDHAFERRFLYKIEFAKPDVNAKQAIWQSMLPALDEVEARSLATTYDFSGGQIENIVRKQTVDAILYGEGNRMERLTEACNSERIGKGATKQRIGFV
jgi:hypothetical protein